MPLRKFVDSANAAINGILHAAKTQRHMRYHLIAALLLLVFSLLLGVNWTEFAVLVVLAVIVISTEMLNTALETITDFLFKEYDTRARIIKDTAAGAVLITALGAAVIGYMILFAPLKKAFREGITIAKHAGDSIAVISLIAVLILVVLTKTFLGKGMPLKGGMPSGHAAVAFSIWTAVTFMTEGFMPSLLIFLMAVLIAQSRIATGIHKPWEVILGALVGIAVTFSLFRLFS
ncbi:MAG: diacylglycerol kinase [Nitrospirae bacterium]|nr:diacylglycerol kinase [Nitrospirota bacterium]